jgi:hypothetical protein
MGIKNLNRFLLDNCNKKSIKKIHLKQFENKKVVIDTSIYLYKFIADDSLLENMYLFISIMKSYNIEPIFVFDGKPPPEKKELLIKRRIEKLEAEQKYNEIQKKIEQSGDELKESELLELEYLKKQFIRIRDEDIQNVKRLMDAYDVTHIDSKYEADQLCVHMVKSGIAWACISDDMDMFLYGCNRVIRHISLLNHTAVLYDVDMILKDLKMREETFRQIMVLSGTDYNINMDTNLYDTMKWFDEYNKYLLKNKDLSNINFYEWLDNNTEYIKNKELLTKSYDMFLIGNYDFSDVSTEFIKKGINMESLKNILFKEGFIFCL